jgi:3-isopropylmalate/(R)-2-methylmalate dehydratase small subunit
MTSERIERISGRALPLRGDNIDTDRIIPARFLRAVSFEGLEQHLFADDRAQAEAAPAGSHPLSDTRYAGATILVVNANFGCGSSREHAPQAIRRRGFHALLGESFSEIFFGNALALGMPCASAPAADIDRILRDVEGDPDLVLRLDLREQVATLGDHACPISLPRAAREAFLDGSWDATGLLLERFEDVERVAATLPYVAGWTD